jgi:5'-nucleotidase
MKKPNILLTNDDGIYAPGLKHLWKSLKDFCNIYIVAPSSEQSGTGAGVSLKTPLHVDKVEWEEGTPAWQVSGTPADCVRVAICILLDTPPDLVVSGINKGSNSGRNVLYSGTVGGIIESVMRNIPGIAFSCEDFYNPAYESFESQTFPLVEYILKHPLSSGTFLNVNFPSSHQDSHKGYKLARQGMGYYKENFLKGTHPEGKDYYWMGGALYEHEDEYEDSDVHLLKSGYITAVPVHVKELTDLKALRERQEHFNDHFQKA